VIDKHKNIVAKQLLSADDWPAPVVREGEFVKFLKTPEIGRNLNIQFDPDSAGIQREYVSFLVLPLPSYIPSYPLSLTISLQFSLLLVPLPFPPYPPSPLTLSPFKRERLGGAVPIRFPLRRPSIKLAMGPGRSSCLEN
jgi:hypothetical protein